MSFLYEWMWGSNSTPPTLGVKDVAQPDVKIGVILKTLNPTPEDIAKLPTLPFEYDPSVGYLMLSKHGAFPYMRLISELDVKFFAHLYHMSQKHSRLLYARHVLITGTETHFCPFDEIYEHCIFSKDYGDIAAFCKLFQTPQRSYATLGPNWAVLSNLTDRLSCTDPETLASVQELARNVVQHHLCWFGRVRDNVLEANEKQD